MVPRTIIVVENNIVHYDNFLSPILWQNGDTVLMVASSRGKGDVVKVLLEAKADPNITNEVKLHYNYCLYNSNLMHYVTEW